MAEYREADCQAPMATVGDESGSDERQPEGFDIFVSYRIRPDEELAGELKVLLESTMDPKPRVFVSGLGGLRASADGYREQLRAAARNAKAYVGLITKASIDREWIFFEAGAAFGRSVLYAPVLVDVSASQLPSSIGGYQGVMAKDSARMRELTEDLAKELGSQSKTHFAQRYVRFAKAVESYGKNDKEEELSGVPLAIGLMERGLRQESEKLFDELIATAGNPEMMANIRITKLVFCRAEGADLLEMLEAQPSEVKTTSVGKLWMGVYETNPLRAVSLLREAWEGGLEGFHRRWALTALASREFELGHATASTSRLLEGLASEERRLRSDAARELAMQIGDESPLGKLLLLVEATLDSSFDHWHDLAQYCWKSGHTALALNAADACVAKKDCGDSRLARGLARNQANLRSLAFEDYRAAAKQGVSVAKSNMAALLNSGPVAEAGLEILREHGGIFDCSDPGLPYAVRGDLERSVAREREEEETLSGYGGRIVSALHRLVASWLSRRKTVAQGEASWHVIGAKHQGLVTVAGDKVSATLDHVDLAVEQIRPFEGFYVAREGDTVRLLIVMSEEPEAVAIDGFVKTGRLEWLRLRTDP